jgi:AcrR family transcriptional regulator
MRREHYAPVPKGKSMKPNESQSPPDSVKREIMEATYRALSEHGYGSLTIQAIADEFENSKSLLYYHYEGKDDLLVDFLDYALHRFLDEIRVRDQRPAKQLWTLVDILVPETLDDDPYRVQLAMFELRVNAPHDSHSRQQYLEVDRELKALLRDIIQQGVESGEFVAVDPDIETEHFLSSLTGVRTRRLTMDDEFPTETAREALLQQIRRLESDPSILADSENATGDGVL